MWVQLEKVIKLLKCISYLWHFHYWHSWLRVGKSNVFALVVSVASKRNNIKSTQRMSYNRATFV